MVCNGQAAAVDGNRISLRGAQVAADAQLVGRIAADDGAKLLDEPGEQTSALERAVSCRHRNSEGFDLDGCCALGARRTVGKDRRHEKKHERTYGHQCQREIFHANFPLPQFPDSEGYLPAAWRLANTTPVGIQIEADEQGCVT